jgi:hypothetical protein
MNKQELLTQVVHPAIEKLLELSIFLFENNIDIFGYEESDYKFGMSFERLIVDGVCWDILAQVMKGTISIFIEDNNDQYDFECDPKTKTWKIY